MKSKILLLFLVINASVNAQIKEIDSSNFNFIKPQVGNYIIIRDISQCRLGDTTKTDKDKILAYLITLLSETNFILQIENHTDCRANKEFNLQLTDRVSKTYKRFFLLKGVDSSQIFALGMGSSELFLEKCNCNNNANTCLSIEHLLNRRTVFRIVGRKEE